MKFALDLSQLQKTESFSSQNTFNLPIPSSLSKVVEVTDPGSTQIGNEKIGSEKDEDRSDFRPGFRFGGKSAEKGALVESIEQDQTSRSAVPKHTKYKIHPGFEANFSVGSKSFSDFGGLIRRGLRVRGEAEIDRTNHAVLVVRSGFVFKDPMKLEDRLWAELTLPEVEIVDGKKKNR